MRRVYARLGSSCPRLHTLALGQSFFFQRGLISDLNTVLAKVTRKSRIMAINITNAVKRSIGFTIGFHNHGECPY